MTKKNRPKKNDIRNVILDVAERQLAENGIRSVTTRGVAAEVGCVGGTIYTYFADLDDLILHVNSRTLRLLNDRLVAVGQELQGGDESKDDLGAVFYGLALAYLDFAIEEPQRWAALFDHRMPDGKPIPDWHLKDHLDLFRHIQRPLAHNRPQLTEDESMALARTIYSAVHGVVSLSLEDRLQKLDGVTIRQHLRILSNAIASGI